MDKTDRDDTLIENFWSVIEKSMNMHKSYYSNYETDIPTRNNGFVNSKGARVLDEYSNQSKLNIISVCLYCN